MKAPVLLGALNTGHDGGAGTLHANTPADVPARLEALGLLGGLPRAALHAQVLAALQVVVQVRRTSTGRVLESICVLLPTGPERFATVVTAWDRVSGPGPAAPTLAALLTTRGIAAPAALVPATPMPLPALSPTASLLPACTGAPTQAVGRPPAPRPLAAPPSRFSGRAGDRP